MVLFFIEEYIWHKKDKNRNIPIFDHVVFSETRTKRLKPLLSYKSIYYENDELNLCFIDNENYNYKKKISQILHFFLLNATITNIITPQKKLYNTWTIKFTQTQQKIDFQIFKKYLRNKKVMTNIPFKMQRTKLTLYF